MAETLIIYKDANIVIESFGKTRWKHPRYCLTRIYSALPPVPQRFKKYDRMLLSAYAYAKNLPNPRTAIAVIALMSKSPHWRQLKEKLDQERLIYADDTETNQDVNT